MKNFKETKLPLNLRPPASELWDKVNKTIPKKYRELFLHDYQNDCACPTERYESDINFLYIDANKKISTSGQHRVVLPIAEDMRVEDIELLMSEVCDKAEENFEMVSSYFKNKFVEHNDVTYTKNYKCNGWM